MANFDGVDGLPELFRNYGKRFNDQAILKLDFHDLDRRITELEDYRYRQEIAADSMPPIKLAATKHSVLRLSVLLAAFVLFSLAFILEARADGVRYGTMGKAAVWNRAFALDKRFIKVTDGDTFKYRDVSHRLYGIDTPEIFHYRCAAEKSLGMRAKLELTNAIGGAKRVLAKRQTRPDKYGRKIAILTADGVNVADALQKLNVAVPYFGTGARKDWCGFSPSAN